MRVMPAACSRAGCPRAPACPRACAGCPRAPRLAPRAGRPGAGGGACSSRPPPPGSRSARLRDCSGAGQPGARRRRAGPGWPEAGCRLPRRCAARPWISTCSSVMGASRWPPWTHNGLGRAALDGAALPPLGRKGTDQGSLRAVGLAVVGFALLACCFALLLRARDFLATDRGPRGLETTSQPRGFFGSGREGALANAPRRERFSTKKDGELSWHPREKNARLVRTARQAPSAKRPTDRACSPAWRARGSSRS